MEVKATFKGPLTVADAKLGQIMVAHHPKSQECFVMRSAFSEADVPAGKVRLIVLSNRVDATEPGYVVPGIALYVPVDTPATFLEQIAPLRLREQTVAGSRGGVEVDAATGAPPAPGLFEPVVPSPASAPDLSASEDAAAQPATDDADRRADAVGEALGDALFTVLVGPLLRQARDQREGARCSCLLCQIRARTGPRPERRDAAAAASSN